MKAMQHGQGATNPSDTGGWLSDLDRCPLPTRRVQATLPPPGGGFWVYALVSLVACIVAGGIFNLIR